VLKKSIKEELMRLVYLINPRSNEVTINDSFENILSTLEEYIIYLRFDRDCFKDESKDRT
jgi:hypothetical protein